MHVETSIKHSILYNIYLIYIISTFYLGYDFRAHDARLNASALDSPFSLSMYLAFFSNNSNASYIENKGIKFINRGTADFLL